MATGFRTISCASFKILDRQRIDKWLWHARMVRRRGDASALAEAGFVRLNGKRVSAPSHPVRVGDVVTLALDRSVRVIQVEGFCEKRVSAPAARALYRDLTTSSGAKACTFSGIPPKVSPRNGR
jgi:ribosome-associated heat shock protein Hsp15